MIKKRPPTIGGTHLIKKKDRRSCQQNKIIVKSQKTNLSAESLFLIATLAILTDLYPFMLTLQYLYATVICFKFLCDCLTVKCPIVFLFLIG